MDIKEQLNALMAKMDLERSKTQLTLGELILQLRSMNRSSVVVTDSGSSLGKAYSYRGYYSDLSFEPVDERVTVGELLSIVEGALGKAYQGYKGGDYTMSKITPLWLASWGRCGRKLLSISESDGIVTITTGEDDD